jgi:hypothetical protein
MDPQLYLGAGQICEVSISGLGSLRNVFCAAPLAAEALR